MSNSKSKPPIDKSTSAPKVMSGTSKVMFKESSKTTLLAEKPHIKFWLKSKRQGYKFFKFLKRRLRLGRLNITKQIFIGLLVGLLVGWWISRYAPHLAKYIEPFSTLFINLIKMIIAPLIFTTLVAGIANVQSHKIGRIGLRALIYFEIVTTLALVIGLLVVNFLKPGVGLHLVSATQTQIVDNSHTSQAMATSELPHSWDKILLHVVPTSIVKAMAEGDVLQIVVFSILFAIALSLLKERGKPVLELCEVVSAAMFKLTHLLMHYAPIGVAAAMAYTVGEHGWQVVRNLFSLVLTLYLALAVFIVLILLPILWMFKISLKKFYMAVREPTLIAFSTTSSEAALPIAFENMEHLGVPRGIVSFILPLGYSFNLDGTTLYLSLAAVFVAQAAGVELTLSQQITMMLTLMLTSKGVAAVPRASLVILTGTLASYNLPIEAVTVILGVDALMDMGRTAVNVVGNCLASVIMAKLEGEFHEPSEAALARALEKSEMESA